jgi:hypothetical protein
LRESGRLNAASEVRQPRPATSHEEKRQAFYMISAVAQSFKYPSADARLHEREGLLKPSRTDGNTVSTPRKILSS